MILECDIGNTRCKWRLLEDGQCIERGVLDTVGEDFQGLPVNAGIQRVRVACVAGTAVESRLQLWARQYLALDCEFARTEAESSGLKNSYSRPEAMGVDRWLAALAAYRACRCAVLVIDLGSALTAEAVDGGGQHLGGYIIPGAELMQKALLAGTEQVHFDQGLPASLALGRSTTEAVNHGTAVALVGAVKQLIEQAGQYLPVGFNIVLTGGGAGIVRPYLPEAVEWRQDLVLDGLGYLLP